MKVGDLVIPKDKGWKKYRKSLGIVVERLHWGAETAIVHWFSGDRNEWGLHQLKIISKINT